MSMNKEQARARRKLRIRKKVHGSAEKPRLTIFKSLKHIYAQLIDDISGKTLLCASSVSKEFSGSGGNVEGAKKVGVLVGDKALSQGIKKIVFDRNGYPYHGRVKALADSLREKGLDF